MVYEVLAYRQTGIINYYQLHQLLSTSSTVINHAQYLAVRSITCSGITGFPIKIDFQHFG
jgi:hypothetical protein